MNPTLQDVLEGKARWCVLERNGLAVLDELPDAVLDAIITDPPYSSGGMSAAERTKDVHTKYVSSTTEIGSVECTEFVGDQRDQRGFLKWCALWMQEALRVTKKGGVFAAFIDWRQLPVMTDAIQCGGWIWRGIVPWVKTSYRPVRGRFGHQCEYVAWGTNGPRDLDILDGTALPGFYEAMPPREREHITQKPIEIMQSLVRIAPVGGLIIDPFAGSGTTAVAAVLEGRRAICCELVPEHAATARARLAAAEAGTDFRVPQQGGLFARAAASDDPCKVTPEA